MRAALLALVTLALLTAALFPGCAGEACCARAESAAIHAPMPCCEQPTVERREVPQRVATAPVAQHAPLVAEMSHADDDPLPPRVKPALATILEHPSDSAAPRFLLHSQLLI